MQTLCDMDNMEGKPGTSSAEERLNTLEGKESTEWCNFWYDGACTQASRRILLVGDSVARQVRRRLSEDAGCPADLFGTSAALRDRMFWDQWECFFKNGLYRYDAIFLWVGNHSRRSEDGKSMFSAHDYRRFEEDFECLARQCMERSPKVIVLTTLHLFKPRKYSAAAEIVRRKLRIRPKEVPDTQENIVVEGKNRIMKAVAERLGLPFCDIDAELMASRYWHKDHIHYIRESDGFVSGRLLGLIEE